jgi:hypothetical protein
MTKEVECLERQYKVAIDARDKLNDNYHRWMTFYYVANGTVLVSITTLYSKSLPPSNFAILVLSVIGILVSIIWNLSCKGYYYWSLNWIDIIMFLERKLANNEPHLMPYNIFSESVALNMDSPRNPLKPANISSPKLTKLMSLFSITCWTIFSLIPAQMILASFYVCVAIQCLILIAFVILVVMAYWQIAKRVISRIKDNHILINLEK